MSGENSSKGNKIRSKRRREEEKRREKKRRDAAYDSANTIQ